MILTINSGSSSLKFAVYDKNLVQQFKGTYERVNCSDENKTGLVLYEPGLKTVASLKKSQNHVECLNHLFKLLENKNIEISGVGHRVVHGGDFFQEPEIIDDEVFDKIKLLTSLAPLHQPHNISGIDAVFKSKNIPQIAVFDTAFHSTIQDIYKTLPIPKQYFREGVKAYGFHGLSYDFISRQPQIKKHNNIVVAHLGNGSSACAMHNHKSHMTTMGFTALDGLMMGTRTGSIDPGVILYLYDSGMSSKDISDLLYKKSGLLGVSELSGDVRDLVENYCKGHMGAFEALNMYADRAAAQILKLMSSLRIIDALVFTGGIGENSAFMRSNIVERLNFAGFYLDEIHNREIKNEGVVSDYKSKPIYVIPTDEEWILADAVKNKLSLM